LHAKGLFNGPECLVLRDAAMLAPVKGVGYSAGPPEAQTGTAMNLRTREIKASLHKLAREVTNVNQALLNDSQRKENTDAIAKLGALRGLVSRKLKAPEA
jgi:hypothetical protein